MDWLTAAVNARAEATVGQTKTKRVAAWRCWNDYLIQVGLPEKIFLDGFSQFCKNIILSVFAQAVRETTFSSRNTPTLVQSTVETTISYVAQAFRASNRPDPRLDLDGKTCFLLQEQWRGYKNTDKNRKKQKALPASVLRKMYEFSSTDWEFALTHLFVLALFFALRSCEYMETRYPEESKRTKILRCKNFTFKKNGCRLNHSLPFETLASADLVIILFEFQKNDWRNHSVHMFCNGDPFLCPVRAAAFTVKRVMKIPGATADSKICSFSSSDGKISCINSAQALPRLRAVVGLIGPESLGLQKMK